MIHNYLIILTNQHYFITFKYVIMANTLKRWRNNRFIYIVTYEIYL